MDLEELDELIATHSKQLQQLDATRAEVAGNIRRLEKLRPTKKIKETIKNEDGTDKIIYEETMPVNDYTGELFTEETHTASINYCSKKIKDSLAQKGK